jgi:hypothetical protein
MLKTGLLGAVLLFLAAAPLAEAQNRAMPSQPQRPGLATERVDGGANLNCTIKGVHVTETAVALSCFTNGTPSHYTAIFTPGDGSGIGAVLGEILAPGMTTSGFPESVQFSIVARTPTRATREQCAIVMGPGYQDGTYGDCRRAISIGRGFR